MEFFFSFKIWQNFLKLMSFRDFFNLRNLFLFFCAVLHYFWNNFVSGWSSRRAVNFLQKKKSIKKYQKFWSKNFNSKTKFCEFFWNFIQSFDFFFSNLDFAFEFFELKSLAMKFFREQNLFGIFLFGFPKDLTMDFG